MTDLRQRLDVISLETDRGFQELKDEVQKLILSVSQGASTFNTVSKAIQSEHRQTRELIVDISRQSQQLQDEKENRKRLLKSLWFDELRRREEKIEDAHRKTFEWIFERPEHCTGSWDNFVEWLEKGDHFYWIHGKAGSGKSTLMSFLYQDCRLSASLATWSANGPVLMPRFYFWSGGTEMERSVEGLLRSLLWQIMNALPELHVELSQEDLHSSGLGPVWTEKRLRERLHDAIQHLPKTHSICFFIDGLDEFDGDQDSLISLLKGIAQNTKIKICLSSRPLQVFLRAFEASSKLCLQDMTRKDIRIFVLDKFREISRSSPELSQELTEKILDRAEGVFLWVSLAVRDLLRGFRNEDSPEQLVKRLIFLPNEIEKVYERMLSQIEKGYRHEAAIFLQIALHGGDSSLLSHTLASHSGLDDMLRSHEKIPILELIKLSHRTRSRIITTCAGLLGIAADQENTDNNTIDDEGATDDEEKTYDQENIDEEVKVLDFDEQRHPISNEGNSGYSDEASDFIKPSLYKVPGEATDWQTKSFAENDYVHFVHRSAVDFMHDPNQGGAFLKDNKLDNFHPQVLYVKVLIARIRLFGLRDNHDSIIKIMSNIARAERDTQVPQTTLCNLLENIMSRIDQRYRDPHDDSHWSERWGDLPESWKRTKEQYYRRQKDSPQTRLSTSTESIKSQPDTLDTSSLILDTEWSFLTFAASHGILRYVRHILENNTTMTTKDVVIYLLHVSILSVHEPNRWIRDVAIILTGLHFAQELLSRGIDLDPEVSSDSTVWSMFLVRMCILLLSTVGITLFPSEDLVLELPAEFAKTMIAFIANGAALKQRIVITLALPHSRTYCFRFDLSVWAVAELCLKGRSELFEIKEACIRAGAPYYARCFSVQISGMLY